MVEEKNCIFSCANDEGLEFNILFSFGGLVVKVLVQKPIWLQRGCRGCYKHVWVEQHEPGCLQFPSLVLEDELL